MLSDYNGLDAGNYTLYLQRLNDPGNTSPITYGDTISESVSTATEADAYVFTGTNGDSPTITMTATSGGLDPRLRVFRPDGTQVCADSLSPGGSLVLPCALDVTGVHTIIASDSGENETGDYDLSLSL